MSIASLWWIIPLLWVVVVGGIVWEVRNSPEFAKASPYMDAMAAWQVSYWLRLARLNQRSVGDTRPPVDAGLVARTQWAIGITVAGTFLTMVGAAKGKFTGKSPEKQVAGMIAKTEEIKENLGKYANKADQAYGMAGKALEENQDTRLALKERLGVLNAETATQNEILKENPDDLRAQAALLAYSDEMSQLESGEFDPNTGIFIDD